MDTSDSTNPPAVVLLSGGLDSATVLAIARGLGLACHALSFDYGQRHRCELEAAGRVAEQVGAASHKTLSLDLRAFGGSALTDDIDVPKHAEGEPPPGGIPVTYVPARNLVFLSLALAYAETLDARELFIGVNALDYSGYPDCRPDFVRSFERTANLATKLGVESAEQAFRVRTPLLDLTKAQIIEAGTSRGVDYALTVSCYDPDERGRACGSCDSCHLRRRGFREAGINDPTVYTR